MRHAHDLLVTVQVGGRKSEFVQALKKNVRIHDPHDDFFTKCDRYRRNTYFYLNTAFIRLDTTILRSALFGHIQAGQGFDPTDNGIVDLLGQLVNGVQHAIDSHAHQDGLPFGFDMNVTGPLFECIQQNMVNGINDMLVIGRQVIPGFESAVLGLEPGQSSTTTIPPEDGYGPRRTDLIVKMQRTELPDDVNPEVGQHFHLSTPDGPPVPVIVSAVGPMTVTFDANHPLAGKTLIFDIKLVSVE